MNSACDAEVAVKPAVLVIPADASLTATGTAFTLLLADAASLGDPDVAGDYRHFLQNGATATGTAGLNATFELTAGTVVTDYAAPGPIAGTGPHRCAFILPSIMSAGWLTLVEGDQ